MAAAKKISSGIDVLVSGPFSPRARHERTAALATRPDHAASGRPWRIPELMVQLALAHAELHQLGNPPAGAPRRGAGFDTLLVTDCPLLEWLTVVYYARGVNCI
jgi:hypothetical protein